MGWFNHQPVRDGLVVNHQGISCLARTMWSLQKVMTRLGPWCCSNAWICVDKTWRILCLHGSDSKLQKRNQVIQRFSARWLTWNLVDLREAGQELGWINWIWISIWKACMQEIEYGNILLKCSSSRFSGEIIPQMICQSQEDQEIIVTVVKDCRLDPMSIWCQNSPESREWQSFSCFFPFSHRWRCSHKTTCLGSVCVSEATISTGGSFQKEAMTLPTWALDYPPLEAEGLVIQVGLTLILLLLSSDMGTIWANIHMYKYIYIVV